MSARCATTPCSTCSDPALVDGATGYRLYRRDQLEPARTILRLRNLEVPLETIRGLLSTDDQAEQGRLLLDHRARIESQTFRLQRIPYVLGLATLPEARIYTQGHPTNSRRPCSP